MKIRQLNISADTAKMYMEIAAGRALYHNIASFLSFDFFCPKRFSILGENLLRSLSTTAPHRKAVGSPHADANVMTVLNLAVRLGFLKWWSETTLSSARK